MLISKVIRKARSGELSNVSEEKFTDDVIMDYIELGLIELYKRFQLRSAEAVITMEDGRTLYTLDSTDAAVSMDTTAMDIMVIQEAYEESGARININVENDELGIMTPGFNQVQIPNPAEGEQIGIIYLAGPKDVTDVNQSFDAPISLLEAMLHYIGYRAHGSIDGNVEAENSTHYQRFEASVQRARMLGVVTADNVAERDTTRKYI